MKRLLFLLWILTGLNAAGQAWIRINQLGYTPAGIKVAVLGTKTAGWPQSADDVIPPWVLRTWPDQVMVAQGSLGRNYGAYGPFVASYRIDFSRFAGAGQYYLEVDKVRSPVFTIGENAYQGAAEYCLRYMRQQRNGFNPFLRDSCHTHDGYVLYGRGAGIPDSTYLDVTGGWHDASDYLQYSSTSANATFHLLAAYRDFPAAFTDSRQGNGLEGSNGIPDVLDEAKWGLDWLLKMHPKEDWMFNQLGDDRDHRGMRIPREDTDYYGRGFERPVYFIDGLPQQRGKFLNATTGTSSTAGKFAAAFALGQQTFRPVDSAYASVLFRKALSAYAFGKRKPGFTQTVSVRSPYIYAEMNWVDDMELGAASLYNMTKEPGFLGESYAYGAIEKITPWLGADTAAHYQWYPFINPGHYELAKATTGESRKTLTGYYREGIQRVWNKARTNAFFRGIPYIWCSNNLTTAFAIQCYWYRQLTGDRQFSELEQANFDWLFGCNPWGTSMVYGLPAGGDTPVDPHSAFTHLKKYPIDGGLVDGPVYGSIYNNLIGITLYEPDEYAEFQSDLAVYHDDYGDYSTNEPTMDGTASLIYLLAARDQEVAHRESKSVFSYEQGAIRRGDSTKKKIALVFTGHEFGEGGAFIAQILRRYKLSASFFLTGAFYRQPAFRSLVKTLKQDGHYLGPHSDAHLLYCDWTDRSRLLVSRQQFTRDLQDNLAAMRQTGLNTQGVRYFLPPYEWYNDSIAAWTRSLGMQLVNFTPGTLSTVDYTTPDLANYRGSEAIHQSILNRSRLYPAGLNGFILLVHIGAGPARTDKFYRKLPALLSELRSQGYRFVRIDELLSP